MTTDKIQLQDDDDEELLETLKRATVTIIKLDEEARKLREENRCLIETVIRLKSEVDILRGDTEDDPNGLSLAIYKETLH